MATNKNTLKSWFETGDFPTQAQFWAWIDSYWHKDEEIPISVIKNLSTILTGKATTQETSNLQDAIDAINTALDEGVVSVNGLKKKVKLDLDFTEGLLKIVATGNGTADAITEIDLDERYLDDLGALSKKDTIDDNTLLDDKVVSESKLSTNVQTKLNYSSPNNYNATAPPTANDDEAAGWNIGSVWIDTSGEESYRCLDNSNGAAVWVKTTLGTDELGDMALEDKTDYVKKDYFNTHKLTELQAGSFDDYQADFENQLKF